MELEYIQLSGGFQTVLPGFEFGRSTLRILSKARTVGLWALLPLQLKQHHFVLQILCIFWWVFKRGFDWFKKNHTSKLELGNHWSSSNLSFYRWERGPCVKWLVPGFKKLSICVIILSIYKKSLGYILTWEVHCILIHRVLLRSWFSLFSCHLVQSSTPKYRM